jgi:selenide,water dikinase
MRNAGARGGDVLILTKPLGVGVLSAALKGGALDAAAHERAYAALVTSATKLNAVGADLAALHHVHAITDVTGFGLLGHCLEMCRGSALGARIRFDALPLLEGVADLARNGTRTGASGRNWASYGHEADLAPELAEWQRDLLTDPQTSGGLLVAVAPEGVDSALACIKAAGFDKAAVIGEMCEGPPRLTAV